MATITLTLTDRANLGTAYEDLAEAAAMARVGSKVWHAINAALNALVVDVNADGTATATTEMQFAVLTNIRQAMALTSKLEIVDHLASAYANTLYITYRGF